MFRLPLTVLALLVAAAVGIVTFSGLVSAADDPEKVIKYRQTMMKATASQITNIFSVLKGETSFAAHIAANARAISDNAVMILDVFPQGSGEGSTRALPLIWQDWAKFEEAAVALKAAADKVAVAADVGDMEAVGTAAGKIGKACGGCHEPFRKKN